MLRRFARVNSVPLYRIECTDNNAHAHDDDGKENRPPVVITPHDEYKYLNLIHDIMEERHEHISRNGITSF